MQAKTLGIWTDILRTFCTKIAEFDFSIGQTRLKLLDSQELVRKASGGRHTLIIVDSLG
jgi:hypothetical protein